MANVKLHKYPPEQISAELVRPKRHGGRPRKYATDAERQTALRASYLRAYQRKKYQKFGLEIPEEYAVRVSTYATDEERHAARIKTEMKCYEAHRAQYNFQKMVTYARSKT
jgi:hypothetical protein